MTEETFRAHPIGDTPGIEETLPTCIPRTERCELPLNIGIFFDGTGNNQDWDEADSCSPGLGMTQREYRKDSNVARLHRAYPDEPSIGYYPVYVPGVGTPCRPIGENEPDTFGMGFGAGGDGRINYALLYVLDSIHRAISNNQPAFSDETVIALCRNGIRIYDPGTRSYSRLRGRVDDEKGLMAVGMQEKGGLLCSASGGRDHARTFLLEQARKIADKVAATRQPRLVEITIDVFGFSRGAAQARVFCNWLGELMAGNRLCGVPATIRFLGIFDTVASVGLPNSAPLGNGHGGWAQPRYLAISPYVRQCVHYVAMHENRASFPLESVRRPDGSLPANCRQYTLPGMHSDVGGGYAPNDQGRGPSGDPSDALSQIPLELMYNAACAAQVPLNKIDALDGDYDPFAVHPDLRQAFDAFMSVNAGEKTIAQWLLPYLAWRYQIREAYANKLSWVTRASARDREDLEGANRILRADIEALETNAGRWTQSAHTVLGALPLIGGRLSEKGSRLGKLSPEARALLGELRAQPVLGTPENPERLTPQAYLFANYVHDSYAGFRPLDSRIDLSFAGCRDILPGSWEPEGYLRYRRFYHGDDTPLSGAPPTPGHPDRTREADLHWVRHNVDPNKLSDFRW
ncbi:T6SS phospholipase effector Tle1-like catalytic domain-containing protein [Zestomonas carbonaria]|uniref:T6SS Phospholipase effector Tle1-like catalytic domain-containing protein n=1 Tax=Zestomonas carbonaria TaxID=2762745 RepID=A0A7U7EQH2_9GAMM|nr:DUF2235 domain-containing protein [Pseudomonas carbonaria]CAD5108260.1 hypothetical protein PSEWESI4_02545 [Pseudomonas carbonaria]